MLGLATRESGACWCHHRLVLEYDVLSIVSSKQERPLAFVGLPVKILLVPQDIQPCGKGFHCCL